jgi:hypothetical protein
VKLEHGDNDEIQAPLRGSSPARIFGSGDAGDGIEKKNPGGEG